MRRSLTLSFAVASTLLAGAAYAQAQPRPEMTRAAVEERTAARFQRMDTNADGVLDQADREAARRQAFDRVDTDRDGTLSFAEYEARRDTRAKSRASRGLDRRDRAGLTRGADADSDGTVTQAEFTSAALARFDRADADSNGTISAEERRDARHHGRHERRARPARDAG